MQRTNPKLSIIITSYQNPELLRLCLESIKKNAKDLEYETIVADSSTGEQTYDLFKEDFKEEYFNFLS